MLNVFINDKETIVENEKTRSRWTISTINFFGRVYEVLEKKFPASEGKEVAKRILVRINNCSQDEDDWIFHCREYGNTLNLLNDLIESRSILSFSLKDIEGIRIEYGMKANYLPAHIGDDTGMRFENLKSVWEVVIAYLFYCAYNEYNLVKCAHCERWFATKTLKTKYCNRISPCYNMIVAGKKVLGQPEPCKQAVKTIQLKFSDRKKVIYNTWSAYGGDEDDSKAKARRERCEKFYARCEEFRTLIRAHPTVENICAYQEYLYSDEMPKQTRPKRRSNSGT